MLKRSNACRLSLYCAAVFCALIASGDPPRLETHHDLSFESDQRSVLKVEGQTAIRQSALVMSQGSVIGSSVPQSLWLEVVVTLGRAVPEASIQFTFRPEGADCIVVLSPTGDSTTVTCFEDSRSDETRVKGLRETQEAREIRSGKLNVQLKGQWTFSMRYGRIRVSRGENYFDCFLPTRFRKNLSSWSIYAGTNEIELGRIRVNAAVLSEAPNISADLKQKAAELSNRITQLSRQRKDADAVPLAREYLELVETKFADDLLTAQVSNVLSSSLVKTSQFDAAIDALQKCLDIESSYFGEDHPYTSSTMSGMASMYTSRGNFVAGLPLARTAYENLRVITNRSGDQFAKAASNLGAIYDSMNDSSRALPMFEEAAVAYRAGHGEDHVLYAIALNNLAPAYQKSGRLDKALDSFDKVKEIFKTKLGNRHPAYAVALNNYASICQTIGKNREAAESFKEAGTCILSIFGKDHPLYAPAVSNLALAYASLKDFDRAISTMQEARILCERQFGHDHMVHTNTIQMLAQFHAELGQIAKAEQLQEEAVTICRRMLDGVSVIQSQRQQLAWNQRLRKYLDQRLSLALQGGNIAQAYESVVNWKGATLIRQRKYRSIQSPQAKPLLKKLDELVNQLATMQLSRRPVGPPGVASRRMTNLSSSIEDVESQLAQLDRLESHPEVQSVHELQELIPESTALIDIIDFQFQKWGADSQPADVHLLAFVVTADKPVRAIDLGPSDKIAALTTDWHKALVKYDDVSTLGGQLREVVWKPLERELSGIKRVLISPDGSVAKIAFASLPGRKSDSFLIEDYEIGYVPVPRLLAPETEDVPSSDDRLLVLGDVDYGTAKVALNRSSFGSLPGTKQEIQHVKQSFTTRFGQSKIDDLRENQATEKAFKELVRDATFVHLATHGFTTDPGQLAGVSSTSVNPGLMSGLVLSGANRGGDGSDDGILYAAEIALLQLSHVDLVVLSACELGLGIRMNPEESVLSELPLMMSGEGMIGVQQAFQVAGARSTVASMWKVDDLATSRLMQRFYSNMWQRGMSKLAAIREAQIWMIRDPQASSGLTRGKVVTSKSNVVKNAKSSGTVHPRFWGAFVISGQ